MTLHDLIVEPSGETISVDFFRPDGAKLGESVRSDRLPPIPRLSRERLDAMRTELLDARGLKPRELRRAEELLVALEDAEPTAVRRLLVGRHEVTLHHRRSANASHLRAVNDRHVLYELTVSDRPARTMSLLEECSDDTVLISDACSAYDPSWDPTPVLQDVAAMQSEVAMGESSVTAAIYDPIAEENCRVEKMEYYEAVYAFVAAAGGTLFFAFRHEYAKSAAGLLTTSAALWRVNVKLAAYQDCLNRYRTRSRVGPA